MGLRPVILVTALLTLPARGSGYVFPSLWCRGYSAHQASPPATPHAACTTASLSVRASTRLRLRRDEIPEENLRQIEAADRRVKELEEEYWKSLDAREVAIERRCSSGLACLKMGLLDRAAEDYAAANKLRWVYTTASSRARGRHCGDGGVPFVLLRGEVQAGCSCARTKQEHRSRRTRILRAAPRAHLTLRVTCQHDQTCHGYVLAGSGYQGIRI